MKIKVNDKSIELSNGSSITDLVKQLALDSKKGIAVAVNDSVISKKEWNTQKLSETDRIIIITAAQGG